MRFIVLFFVFFISCTTGKDVIVSDLKRYHFKKRSCKDNNDSLLFNFPEYLTDTIFNPLWKDFDQERNIKWDLMSHRVYIDGISIRRAYMDGDSINIISYTSNGLLSESAYPITKHDSFFLDIGSQCIFYYHQDDGSNTDLGHETHVLKNKGEVVGILIITNGSVMHTSNLNTDSFDKTIEMISYLFRLGKRPTK